MEPVKYREKREKDKRQNKDSMTSKREGDWEKERERGCEDGERGIERERGRKEKYDLSAAGMFSGNVS